MRKLTHRVCVFLAACGAVFAGVTGAGQTQGYRPVTEAMALNPPPEDWLHFRRTYDHQAYSPLTQINRQNARQLTLAWSWRVHPGDFEGTPQVHDGIMFIANPNGGVQALNAATGDLLWDFEIPINRAKGPGSGDDDRDPEATRSVGILNAVGPSRPVRNLALWGDKVYTATTRADGGRLVALDARTGKVVWQRQTEVRADGQGAPGDHSAGPIVVKGKVMLGTTNCERYTNRNPPCWIAAFDAETGKEVWRTSTIQRPGDPGPDTWGGMPLLLRAGADNWQAASYDPKTNLTYWGTAQAKPWVRFQRGTDGDALYSGSTLALNADTGKMEWYYQHIPGESFDMDETFERVLVDYEGKSSSFSMGKIGILWELDRRTGAFRAAHDVGYQDQGTIDPKTGQLRYLPGRLPQDGVEVKFCPGVTGVKSWKAMAYDPETQAMYIPLFPHCQSGTFLNPKYEPVEGAGGTGVQRGTRHYLHPKSPDHLGDFVAMDIKTGKILWRHRTRTPPTTSAIATAGGLVVVADWDRYMRVYDARDGKILYETRLPSPASGSPSTYSVGGRQYIAMPVGTGSGGNWVTIPRRLAPEIKTQSWDEHLTGLFVFALPDRQ
jgi:PQQ-dependent dehydrogenase (methanol/ethanol family)